MSVGVTGEVCIKREEVASDHLGRADLAPRDRYGIDVPHRTVASLTEFLDNEAAAVGQSKDGAESREKKQRQRELRQ